MLALELNQDNIQKWICSFNFRMENKWNGITTVLSQIPLPGEQKRQKWNKNKTVQQMVKVSYQWSRIVGKFWNMEYLNRRKKREREREQRKLQSGTCIKEDWCGCQGYSSIMSPKSRIDGAGVTPPRWWSRRLQSLSPKKINNYTAIHKWKHLWESSGVHLRNLSKQYKGTKTWE